MTDIKNPALVKAIRVLSISDNRKTRFALYQALLKSTLILPVWDAGGRTGEVPLPEDAPIALMQSETSDGEPLLLAFTDRNALARWEEDSAYIVLRATDLFPVLAVSGAPMLMINIAGPVGGEVTPTEIHYLARGRIPGTPDAVEREFVDESTPIGLAPLRRKPPARLVSQLKRHVADFPEVSAVYLFMFKHLDTPPMMMAGIQFDNLPGPDELDRIMRGLASGLPPAVVEYELSFAALQGEMLEVVQEIARPVYKRK